MPEVSKASLLEIFGRRYKLEEELYQQHRIREEGGYAARLVAEALGATVNTNGVEAGYDLTHPAWNRIEVRSRRLPFDGRNETRAVIPEKKIGKFDWLAHILFKTDYSLVGAYLVSASDVIARTKPGDRKLPFDVGSHLPSAKDITAEVEAARQRL